MAQFMSWAQFGPENTFHFVLLQNFLLPLEKELLVEISHIFRLVITFGECAF
jgi:hypothetical protein